MRTFKNFVDGFDRYLNMGIFILFYYNELKSVGKHFPGGKV